MVDTSREFFLDDVMPFRVTRSGDAKASELQVIIVVTYLIEAGYIGARDLWQ